MMLTQQQTLLPSTRKRPISTSSIFSRKKRQRIHLADAARLAASSRELKKQSRQKIPVLVTLTDRDIIPTSSNNTNRSTTDSSTSLHSTEHSRSQTSDVSSCSSNPILRTIVYEDEPSVRRQGTVAKFCRDIVENLTTNQWLFHICRQNYQQKKGNAGSGAEGSAENAELHAFNLTISYGNGYFTTVLLRKNGSDDAGTHKTFPNASISMILKLRHSNRTTMMDPSDSIWDQLSNISLQSKPIEVEVTTISNVLIDNSKSNDSLMNSTLVNFPYSEGKNHAILITLEENGDLGAAQILHPRVWHKMGLVQHKKIPIVVNVDYFDDDAESTSAVGSACTKRFPSFPLNPVCRMISNDAGSDKTVAMFCRDIIESMSTTQWLLDVCKYHLKDDETPGKTQNRSGNQVGRDLDLTIRYGHGLCTKVKLRNNKEKEADNTPTSPQSETQCQQATLYASLMFKGSDSSIIVFPSNSVWDQLQHNTHNISRLLLTPNPLINAAYEDQNGAKTFAVEQDNRNRNHVVALNTHDGVQSKAKLWTKQASPKRNIDCKQISVIVSLEHDNRGQRVLNSSGVPSQSIEPSLKTSSAQSKVRAMSSMAQRQPTEKGVDSSLYFNPTRKVISSHDDKTAAMFCRDIVESVATNKWLSDIALHYQSLLHNGDSTRMNGIENGQGTLRQDIDLNISYGSGYFTKVMLRQKRNDNVRHQDQAVVESKCLQQAALSFILKVHGSNAEPPIPLSPNESILKQVSKICDTSKSLEDNHPRICIQVISHAMMGKSSSPSCVSAAMKRQYFNNILLVMKQSGEIEAAKIVLRNEPNTIRSEINVGDAIEQPNQIERSKRDQRTSEKAAEISKRPTDNISSSHGNDTTVPNEASTVMSDSSDDYHDFLQTSQKSPGTSGSKGRKKVGSGKKPRDKSIDKRKTRDSSSGTVSATSSISKTKRSYASSLPIQNKAPSPSSTNRTVMVGFLSLDHSQCKKALKISVPTTALLADLQHIFHQKLRTQNSDIILAYIRDNEIQSIFDPITPLSVIRDNDSIFAYQVPSQTLIESNLRTKEAAVKKALENDMKKFLSKGLKYEISEGRRTALNLEKDWAKRLQTYLVVPLFKMVKANHDEKLLFHSKLSKFLTQCYTAFDALDNTDSGDINALLFDMCEQNSDTFQNVKDLEDVSILRFCTYQFYRKCIYFWINQLTKTRTEIGFLFISIKIAEGAVNTTPSEKAIGPPLIVRISNRLTVFGLRSLLAHRLKRAMTSVAKDSSKESLAHATSLMRQVPLSYQNSNSTGQLGFISRTGISNSGRKALVAIGNEAEEKRQLFEVVQSNGKVTVHFSKGAFSALEWVRTEVMI